MGSLFLKRAGGDLASLFPLSILFPVPCSLLRLYLSFPPSPPLEGRGCPKADSDYINSRGIVFPAVPYGTTIQPSFTRKGARIMLWDTMGIVVIIFAGGILLMEFLEGSELFTPDKKHHK
jgi:hypothetical protein